MELSDLDHGSAMHPSPCSEEVEISFDSCVCRRAYFSDVIGYHYYKGTLVMKTGDGSRDPE